MEVMLQNVLSWAEDNAQALMFFLFSFAFFLLSLAVVRIGQQLFLLYRRQFLVQVDKGLRDVVVMMEPGQVFVITIIAAALFGPLMYWLTNWAVAASVVAFILIAPSWILRMMKNKRSDKFVEQLPDALSAMSSALRSGLNLVKSLQQLVKNQPQPLAQEFAQVLVEYRVGTDLNESLDGLAKRIERQEVVLMNSAIKISRAVGGNLADTLETLSKTLREKSKVEGKIRALTAMGKAQGTMATFFPVFIGYVFYKIEPLAMAMLFTSRLGHIWLGVMVGMAIMAYLMIRKIVSVDI
ncbi:MAG: type II secretion system F family protein [Gammaproteobacteria bacterium]